MSTLKPCDVTDVNSLNYHPYATCCGKCEKFEREKPYQARLLAQHIEDAKQSEIEYRKKTMKQFNALKKVNAKSMNRQEYNNLRGWPLPADEDGSDEGYLTEDINAPSNLEGWDGYISWTPKAIFEEQFYEADDKQVDTQGGDAYREIMFNGWLAKQQADKKCTAPSDPEHELTEDEVATLASNGSLCDCMEVVQYGGDCPIEEGDEFDFGSAIYLMQKGERVMRAGWNGKNMWLIYIEADQYELKAWKYFNATEQLPFIALKTADNKIVPWTISQSDALATDWCLA